VFNLEFRIFVKKAPNKWLAVVNDHVVILVIVRVSICFPPNILASVKGLYPR
jgi:hypothetical protein